MLRLNESMNGVKFALDFSEINAPTISARILEYIKKLSLAKTVFSLNLSTSTMLCKKFCILLSLLDGVNDAQHNCADDENFEAADTDAEYYADNCT